MKEAIAYYQIIPAVVPTNTTSRVTIRAREAAYTFKDGTRYAVDITPASIPTRPFTESYKISDIVANAERVMVVAEHGVLTFEFPFRDEQKWNVHIYEAAANDNGEPFDPAIDGWDTYCGVWGQGCVLEMYSLDADLYALRPYKGDLHIHTTRSDGLESPASVAANYRKAGYDFISLTDHHVYDAAQIANNTLGELNTPFAVYNGEEIHPDHMGQMHIVNFDSAYSVNERILGDEREQVLREIEEIQNSEALRDCVDKVDIAWRIWTYREAKKSGGLVIFPHPYWTNFGMEHASPEAIRYTFEHGLLDAFEVYGGITQRERNFQALLYHEMKAAGYEFPLVGSTDSHSSRESGYLYFDCAYTIAFAESARAIRRAVEQGYTVAVSGDPGQHPEITGSLRFAKYADFLMNNYFPLHDELCAAAGLMLQKYVQGDAAAQPLYEALERYVLALETEFFG